jgi:hypothetical protein
MTEACLVWCAPALLWEIIVEASAASRRCTWGKVHYALARQTLNPAAPASSNAQHRTQAKQGQRKQQSGPHLEARMSSQQPDPALCPSPTLQRVPFRAVQPSSIPLCLIFFLAVKIGGRGMIAPERFESRTFPFGDISPTPRLPGSRKAHLIRHGFLTNCQSEEHASEQARTRPQGRAERP